MTNVTVQLSDREIEALKAWAARANAKRSITELRAALKDSLKEEATGKGRYLAAVARPFVGSRANHSAALQARL